MIKPYKDRVINKDELIQVYRNLNVKGSHFSIRQSNKVVAHGNKFTIKIVRTWVNENGRQRVLKEKRKNVHAVLIGYFGKVKELDVSGLDELYYDPYVTEWFINKRTGEQMHDIDEVYCRDGKVYIVRE